MDDIEELESERSVSDKVIISRTLKYIKPYKWQFFAAILVMIVVVILELLGPFIIGKALAVLGRDYTEIVYMTVFLAAIGYLATVVGNLLFIYIMTIILQKAGQLIVYNLRQDVFSHIESLSTAQMNAIPVGKLVTRVTSDTNAVNELYTNTLVNLLRNIITLVGIIAWMFVLDVELAIYMVVFMPLVAIISIVFRKYTKNSYRRVRKDISELNAYLSENLSGMKITQVFNQEERKLEEFDEANNKLRKSKFQQMLIYGVFRPIISFLYIFAIGLVFYIGTNRARLASDPIAEMGIVYAFYLYISKFFGPIQQLAEQFNGIQQAFAASERLFNLLDTPPIVHDDDKAIELVELKGKIEFKDVWFAYEKDNWILRGVSFIVEPNQSFAFVGATGAGKTTILSLIVRNHEIQKGQILIDDIDIRHIKIESLRRHIGQMLQDVFLFSGTIASNISLRDDRIPLEEIIDSSRYVGVDTFVEKMEKQYLEPVQERGANFSSGQRQLLSFARTIVHKPRIMILDEATANIDTETEVLIQESLKKMMNIGTMLIVAHRLSTIQHVDRIVVLQKGEVLESGNHQELLKKKGYYYNLYRLQFENQE